VLKLIQPLLLTLLLALPPAQAGNALLEVVTRKHALVTLLEMAGDDAPAQVVLFLAGGDGYQGLRNIDLARLHSEPESMSGALLQLARRVGAVVLVDTATDHAQLDMADRAGTAHRQDIATVIFAMRLRHPKARIVLMGISNGAYSAALLGGSLGQEVDALVLVNGNADAYDALKDASQPVLGVHHRRDACLPFKLTYAKARFYPLLEVDDATLPEVGRSTPRDCGQASAHALARRRARTFGAIGDWLLTGKMPQNID
jgi:predicted esterase